MSWAGELEGINYPQGGLGYGMLETRACPRGSKGRMTAVSTASALFLLHTWTSIGVTRILKRHLAVLAIACKYAPCPEQVRPPLNPVLHLRPHHDKMQ
ncbi:hypothetical protein EJ06DRAFT_530834 [Trichodelitschia bisporula]|uniref:Uncharacterized protein n=1 Tax=Trichodelitschia bisporula TaxID=703511 RepID=A0A6G1HVP8_9PEZI|nr:hypothetical protein EJ06DRAFT_530834 [Trichodelitschia bisporula]